MKELKQALIKEDIRGEIELGTLPKNFYKTMIELIAIMNPTQKADSGRLLLLLSQKRMTKIIRYASMTGTTDILDRLTYEEEKLYNDIVESILEYKDKMDTTKEAKRFT